MVLLTRRDVHAGTTDRKDAAREPASSPPMRAGIGVPRLDLALLVPGRSFQSERASALDSGTARRGHRLGRGVAVLLEEEGFRTTVFGIPADKDPEPDRLVTESIEDARGVLVLCEEGRKIPRVWTAWLLGQAAAHQQRTALFPIARRDPWQRLWALPTPLQTLPYIGRAKAVGETVASLWVIPAGDPPESTRALNLDYWLSRRGKTISEWPV